VVCSLKIEETNVALNFVEFHVVSCLLALRCFAMPDVGGTLLQHQNFIATKSLVNDATSMLRVCDGFATMRWFGIVTHCNNCTCEGHSGGIFEHGVSHGFQG